MVYINSVTLNEGNPLAYYEGCRVTPVGITAPANLKAVVDANGYALLSWQDMSDNEEGFIIQRRTGTGTEFATIDTTAANSTVFSDKSVHNGSRYYYRICSYTGPVKSAYSSETSVLITVDVADGAENPTGFNLLQNYPNPFNPSTVIEYSLAHDSQVMLVIYDAIGNKIATLVNSYKTAGNYRYELDTSELHMNSGIYFYRLSSQSAFGNNIKVKKMILLK
jgi:hypothetical protein